METAGQIEEISGEAKTKSKLQSLLSATMMLDKYVSENEFNLFYLMNWSNENNFNSVVDPIINFKVT